MSEIPGATDRGTAWSHSEVLHCEVHGLGPPTDSALEHCQEIRDVSVRLYYAGPRSTPSGRGNGARGMSADPSPRLSTRLGTLIVFRRIDGDAPPNSSRMTLDLGRVALSPDEPPSQMSDVAAG